MLMQNVKIQLEVEIVHVKQDIQQMGQLALVEFIFSSVPVITKHCNNKKYEM